MVSRSPLVAAWSFTTIRWGALPPWAGTNLVSRRGHVIGLKASSGDRYPRGVFARFGLPVRAFAKTQLRFPVSREPVSLSRLTRAGFGAFTLITLLFHTANLSDCSPFSEPICMRPKAHRISIGAVAIFRTGEHHSTFFRHSSKILNSGTRTPNRRACSIVLEKPGQLLKNRFRVSRRPGQTGRRFLF